MLHSFPICTALSQGCLLWGHIVTAMPRAMHITSAALYWESDACNSLEPSEAYMRNKICLNWIRWWLVVWSGPSHHLDECGFFLSIRPYETYFNGVFISNSKFPLKKMLLKLSFGESKSQLSASMYQDVYFVFDGQPVSPSVLKYIKTQV